jgi:hypothetical protein
MLWLTFNSFCDRLNHNQGKDYSMIIGSKISSKHFTYDKEANAMISDISSLGRGVAFSRLYDDACDEGFVMVSTKTWQGIAFYLDDEIRNIDGDVECWVFKPIKYQEHLVTGMAVIIFND